MSGVGAQRATAKPGQTSSIEIPGDIEVTCFDYTSERFLAGKTAMSVDPGEHVSVEIQVKEAKIPR